MDILKKLSIIFFLVMSFSGISSAGYITLPKDASGWTVFAPSADSRIMYVSTSGNDGTATVYTSGNHPSWSTPFNPGAINAYATYAAAYAQARDGYPDWILFKRGDTFTGQTIGGNVKSGRSETEPQLIGSYGASGLSPILKINSSSPAFNPSQNDRYFALSGISFYASVRDPDSSDYVGISGDLGFEIYSDGAYSITSFLIEGCKFGYFTNNTIQGSTLSYATVRRNVIYGNYTSDTAHSQGIYVGYINNLTVEDNIFDHNGWYDQAGGSIGEATIFNHNIYIATSNNITVQGNIFTRPASTNNKFTANNGASSAVNITVNNNLYVDGEIGIGLGGNETDALRFENVTVSNNVITDMNLSRSTARDLAWGMTVEDWNGGSISNNYIINTNETGSFGMQFTGTMQNVTISGNKIYNFQNVTNAVELNGDRGSSVSNMVFSGNDIQIPTSSGYTINSEYATSGKWTFSGNRYYSSRSDTNRFALSGSDQTTAQWITATGDSSTYTQVTYTDPTRGPDSYMGMQGETATLSEFYTTIREQDRYSWSLAYMACPINNYIREGFDGTVVSCGQQLAGGRMSGGGAISSGGYMR